MALDIITLYQNDFIRNDCNQNDRMQNASKYPS